MADGLVMLKTPMAKRQILTAGRILAVVSTAVCLSAPVISAHASEVQKRKLTLEQKAEQKAEQARIDSAQREQMQLEKARRASNQTQVREAFIQQQSKDNDWEAQQKAKALQQFDERALREQQYLQQAKDAAAQERKLP